MHIIQRELRICLHFPLLVTSLPHPSCALSITVFVLVNYSCFELITNSSSNINNIINSNNSSSSNNNSSSSSRLCHHSSSNSHSKFSFSPSSSFSLPNNSKWVRSFFSRSSCLVMSTVVKFRLLSCSFSWQCCLASFFLFIKLFTTCCNDFRPLRSCWSGRSARLSKRTIRYQSRALHANFDSG